MSNNNSSLKIFYYAINIQVHNARTVAVSFAFLGTTAVSRVKLTRTEIPTQATAKIQLYTTQTIIERGLAGTEESENTAVSGFLLGFGLTFEQKDHTLPSSRHQLWEFRPSKSKIV